MTSNFPCKIRSRFFVYSFAFTLILTILIIPDVKTGLPQMITGSLCGIVRDRNSGKVLVNANIQLVHCRIGAVTDSNGRFIMSKIPAGIDTVCISFIGYENFRKAVLIKAADTLFLKVSLIPRVIQMPEVDVTAWRSFLSLKSMKMEPAMRIISSKDLYLLPAVAVPDLYRALQTLPGVTTTNEASPQFHVRGGNFDQNLVLLDGAPVYYPFHFLGLASSFNVDMIQNVYFSPGGFSACYGDRLSSVINIQTIQPLRKFPNRFNLSLIGSDLTIGNKIGEKLGWIVSGRLSHFDMYKKITGKTIPFGFYDIFGKIVLTPYRGQHLEIFAFMNHDDFKLDEKSTQYLLSATNDSRVKYNEISRRNILYANKVYSIAWGSEISSDLRTRLQLSNSIYSSLFDVYIFAEFPKNLAREFYDSRAQAAEQISKLNKNSGAEIDNQFKDYTAKFSVDYQLTPELNLMTGAQYSRFKTHYGWRGFYNFDSDWLSLFFDHAPEDFFYYHKDFSSEAFYMEGLWDVKSWLHFRQGIRFSKWSYLQKISIEPRFNLQIDFRENWNIKFAYGRFSQGTSTALEEGLLGFLALYFPLENSNELEKADHFICSLAYEKNEIRFSICAYYKKLYGLVKSVKANHGFEFDTTPGQAYGLEAELYYQIFGFPIWMSYVWSHSQRRYNEITYDTNFDQRHRFQISTSHNIGKKWIFSAFWEFHTGQPYSPKECFALYRHYGGFYPGTSDYFESFGSYRIDLPRGRIRYPAYHRLDINISRKIKKQGLAFAPYLSIRNVYARKNVLYYKNIEVAYDVEQSTFHSINPHIERDIFYLSIIPTIGLRVGF